MEGKRKTDGTTIITVVFSVVVILFILWFLANRIIDMTAKNYSEKEQQSASEQALSSEDASMGMAEATEESVNIDENTDTSEQSTEEDTKVEILVEGDADYQRPETWIGKTFGVNEGANVRSGPGTGNGVIQGVSPGDSIYVLKAEVVDDATWVYGKVSETDGKYEGWIYAYALKNIPE